MCEIVPNRPRTSIVVANYDADRREEELERRRDNFKHRVQNLRMEVGSTVELSKQRGEGKVCTIDSTQMRVEIEYECRGIRCRAPFRIKNIVRVLINAGIVQ